MPGFAGLTAWIVAHLLDRAARWNDRRLIIFTEWEDTRRWLERRLKEAIDDTDRADERIARLHRHHRRRPARGDQAGVQCRSGAGAAAHPDLHRCGARRASTSRPAATTSSTSTCRGIPARLEQRNGRIDRKLQPAPRSSAATSATRSARRTSSSRRWCAKTEMIQRQLGSAGQVIAERIDRPADGRRHRRARRGSWPRRSSRRTTTRAVAAGAGPRWTRARPGALSKVEGGDRRPAPLPRARAQAGRRRARASSSRSSASPCRRAGSPLDEAARERVGERRRLRDRSAAPGVRPRSAWQDAFDDLRARAPRSARAAERWRRRVPPRAIAFEPPVQPDGRDADDVVQVHLEHRLVRRLLGRFLSQGFQSGLQPRLRHPRPGRAAARRAARAHRALRPGCRAPARGDHAGHRALDRGRPRHEAAAPARRARRGDHPRPARGRAASDAARPSDADRRACALVRPSGCDRPPADPRAALARGDRQAAERQLAERAEQEAASLAELLERQRRRIERPRPTSTTASSSCSRLDEAERRQLRADRAHWLRRLERIERELESEPARVRDGYRGARHAGSSPSASSISGRSPGERHGPDAQTIYRDPDLEWLDHVQPTGLVLSPTVIKERGLVPERQTGADSAAVAGLLSADDGPALPDPWRLLRATCSAGTRASSPARRAGRPARRSRRRASPSTTPRSPRLGGAGLRRATRPGSCWCASSPPAPTPTGAARPTAGRRRPHQRFERLLRETGVLAGVLLTDQELRLIYAPRGETSGWLAFPLRSLATVAGRPMLAGLKLVLDGFRLFNAPTDQRLRALLKASREAQAAVSTALAEQVLGALHELLRGLNAAEPRADPGPRRASARSTSTRACSAVLLRLVFILYAEDRDLLPSRTDGRCARALRRGLLGARPLRQADRGRRPQPRHHGRAPAAAGAGCWRCSA